MKRPRTVALAALIALALAACTAGTGSSPRPTGTPPVPAGPSSPEPLDASGPTAVDDPLAGWTLEQKVGQLVMAGAPVGDGADLGATRAALSEHHVENVFLHGRSTAGVEATRDLVDELVALTDPVTPMLVATDQEGGFVQVLTGPGFSQVPRPTEQGGWDVEELEEQAAAWGTELAAAGVNLNLAPVMDLVPADNQSTNEPIGYYSRHYGTTAEDVVAGATAFSGGMQASGVEVVIKHFPGLGYVTRNTDTSTYVVDDTVTTDSESVEVFAAGIEAGARYVMVSSAVYTQIDPDEPAMFSTDVVTGLLRDRLGFTGVIMTDDVSAAAAVQDRPPGDRAVDAVAAGVDLVLASADPSVVPAMTQALAERASTDPQFAARVDEAVARILAVKAATLS